MFVLIDLYSYIWVEYVFVFMDLYAYIWVEYVFVPITPSSCGVA